MLSAIILAAGESKRMGQPKMLLPWGNTTVLGKVVETLQRAGIAEILAVTGGARAEVECEAARYGLRCAYNAFKGEMLQSIQAGLRAETLRIGDEVEGAVLIALGDQPQIEEETVRRILAAWQQTGAGIIVPSYEKRRGHPWLVAGKYWSEILALPAEKSMRDFFKHRAGEILYVEVDAPGILQDLDTPEDYLKFKPRL